jgi:D-alanyl-lipoteichoic acid acyltransferase DltB (MBOAT superfamily)
MGFMVNPWSIQVILPVGISFYTFHGLVVNCIRMNVFVLKN